MSGMQRGLVAWLLFDYLCDLVYLLDIVVVQCHLSYINNGTLEVCVCVFGILGGGEEGGWNGLCPLSVRVTSSVSMQAQARL